MKRLWTILGVRDVARSYAWYQHLLGLPPGAPAHTYFGQLRDADGTVLLCVHEWGVEDHPPLTNPEAATPGNGLLLFFRVDDFDAALARVKGTPLAEEPHVNENTGTLELSLRDPDGYYVTISAA
jgi:catechol 2,3-dioxygenase-like lactoylglutathione lyase family enzyme